MPLSTNAVRACAFALAAALSFTGCSTPEPLFPRIINEPAPLAEQARATFGTIGVLPPSVSTNFHFRRPATRAEVFQRVDENTFNWMMDNTHAGHGVDNALGKLFHGTIVSLSAAALASLVKGVPEGNFERSHAALRHALTNETLGLGIYGELSAAIRASDIPQVKVLSESALAKIKTDARTTDLSPLLEQGVDSVLEIGMTEIAFEMKKGFNPDISFAPQVTVNVRRVLDGAVLHTKFFEYRGAERKFTDWGAEDARSFRYEMRQAEREFARVMLDYFLSPPNVTQ